jgi:septation ring formation regulator EzrA
MDQETMLKEILNALQLHSRKMDEKFEKVDARFDQVDARFEQVEIRFNQVDARFDRIEERLDRVESKLGGFRAEMTEVQETVDFMSAKTVQHEKKLREMNRQ